MSHKKSFLRAAGLSAALAAAIVSTGCAFQAPGYQPSLDNVEILKQKAAPTAIGAFVVQAGAVGADAISLRGNSMRSAVGSDYAAYLAEALRQELVMAGKLDPASKVQISGVLLKNDVDASGFSTATGEIEARFSVHRDGALAYEKTLRVDDSWESSLAGPVAIPKAVQQYPLLVQKLLNRLVSDAQFINAIR